MITCVPFCDEIGMKVLDEANHLAATICNTQTIDQLDLPIKTTNSDLKTISYLTKTSDDKAYPQQFHSTGQCKSHLTPLDRSLPKEGS